LPSKRSLPYRRHVVLPIGMTAQAETVVHQALRQLRRDILDGTRPAGSRLPAERDLARDLGISRLSLRAVLARLASEGLVRSRRGSGTEVQPYRVHAGLDILGALAEVSFERGRVPIKLVEELLELRRMLAVEVVGLVAERAEPQMVDRLRSELASLGEACGASGDFMSRDIAFARAFVRAADNLALELLFNSVVRVIQNNARLSLLFDANSGGAVDAYTSLLSLVQKSGGDQVRSRAREIFATLDRDTLRVLKRLND